MARYKFSLSRHLAQASYGLGRNYEHIIQLVLSPRINDTQLLKTFLAIYGIKTSITMVTTARQWSLFWTRSMQCEFISILLHYLCVGFPGGLLKQINSTKSPASGAGNVVPVWSYMLWYSVLLTSQRMYDYWDLFYCCKFYRNCGVSSLKMAWYNAETCRSYVKDTTKKIQNSAFVGVL